MSEATSSRWSTRLAFALAATGSAVGLGNIWKFPYITGENGGGAFVLVYLACIALIGVPVMICEVLVGRLARRSPVNAYGHLAEKSGASSQWAWAGRMALTAGVLVLSFYSVVAGWAVAYLVKAATGAFAGQDADAIGKMFSDLTGSPARLLIWTSAVYVVSALIVGSGVNRGIERSVRWMMPFMFILLVGMVIYGALFADMAGALQFMFNADFSRLTTNGVLVALGHAFFTLSLGAGIMMMYGAYLQEDLSIGKAVVMVAIADTVVALLAGMAIFPIVFSNGLEAGGGPGLVFQTLPLAFGQMAAGGVLGTVFFALLVIAAVASTISILEAVVVFAHERLSWTRHRSVVVCTIAVGALSLLTVFSFNVGQNWTVFGKNPFQLIDYLASNIMLPLGGIAVAVFAGWALSTKDTAMALGTSPSSTAFRIWHATARWLAPLLIGLVFLNAIGLL